jgi:oxalyl-CoA decarboxylase
VIVFNNNGVYRGDEVNHSSSDPAPTVFTPGSRYDKLIEAFGGTGYDAETTACLTTALQQALNTRRPTLINCVIDPKAGTESGHLEHLN